MEACEHLSEIKPVTPSADGCEDCLKISARWVHLRLCEICGELSVDWVKTSTGFGSSGATLADLRLMRKHSPPHVQVKAAGGVQDLDMLLQVREIGCTRSGCSKTADVLGELRKRLALGAQAVVALQSRRLNLL